MDSNREVGSRLQPRRASLNAIALNQVDSDDSPRNCARFFQAV